MPPGRRTYYMYIAANGFRSILYVGVTNDIHRRMNEHKAGVGSAFTAKHNIRDLLYFEEFREVRQAIAREKQVKGWNRRKKLDLIRMSNPRMSDLTSEEAWSDLLEGWDPSTSARRAGLRSG